MAADHAITIGALLIGVLAVVRRNRIAEDIFARRQLLAPWANSVRQLSVAIAAFGVATALAATAVLIAVII
jgi:hypothetical protein